MDKARSLLLEWSPVRGSSLVGPSLARKNRQGWKWQTLAFYDIAAITAAKRFIEQAK
jgi:hypothetical protein